MTRVPVVSLSGGRDSAAVAIWAVREFVAGRLASPRFVHADVGRSMEPDTLHWVREFERKVLWPHDLSLDVVDARNLGNARNLEYESAWASVYERNGKRPVLPGPMFRTCTWRLKIEPIKRWRQKTFGTTPVMWIIGFRADERSEKRRVQTARFADPNGIDEHYRPFVELGYGLPEIRVLMESEGIAEASFYEWTTRSGCIMCFYKPAVELERAATRYPAEFEHMADHEEAVIASVGKRGASPWVVTRDGTLREIVAGVRAQLPLFNDANFDHDRECGDPLGTCSL